MTANAPTHHPAQRSGLRSGGDTPRYWFGGDAFKTRLFDAMSTLFPEGEKFLFSACAITVTRSPLPVVAASPGFHAAGRPVWHDPRTIQPAPARTGDRCRQHRVRRAQAVCVFCKRFSRGCTLAQTAAAEHMTAIMAHSFFNRQDVFRNADPRVRAICLAQRRGDRSPRTQTACPPEFESR